MVYKNVRSHNNNMKIWLQLSCSPAVFRWPICSVERAGQVSQEDCSALLYISAGSANKFTAVRSSPYNRSASGLEQPKLRCIMRAVRDLFNQ